MFSLGISYLDASSKVISNCHLSIRKSRSTALLLNCAACRLYLIKGHKRFRVIVLNRSWTEASIGNSPLQSHMLDVGLEARYLRLPD